MCLIKIFDNLLSIIAGILLHKRCYKILGNVKLKLVNDLYYKNRIKKEYYDILIIK